MPVLKFKRFNKPQILKHIARDLLARFFGRFEEDFAAKNLALPPPDLEDGQYFLSLASLLMSPEGLPDRLNEALFAIDEMASLRGQELLQGTPEWPALRQTLSDESSPEEITLQIWFSAPGVLARTHNAQRLRRLTAFQYASAKRSTPGHPPSSAPAPFSMAEPWDSDRSKRALDALTAGLDAWFARNQRGQGTTRIEVYPMDEEFWFLVRHGDTFARTPKVERQKTEILHFRPERDDVIVYCPERDELRLNARTKGERQLYLEQFGLHLRGRTDYFSEHETYTLEPLRSEGVDALDASDSGGILKIVLRELEVDFGNRNHEVITRAATDLFERGPAGLAQPEAVPKGGTLARAIFELQFAGSTKPRPVEVRPPNTLKFGRRCDAHLVQRWLANRGFRRNGR